MSINDNEKLACRECAKIALSSDLEDYQEHNVEASDWPSVVSAETRKSLSQSPVDLVFIGDDRRLAVEHTRVEEHHGSYNEYELTGHLLEGLDELNVNDVLPKPGVYELTVDIRDRRRKDVDESVVRAVYDWVARTAPDLKRPPDPLDWISENSSLIMEGVENVDELRNDWYRKNDHSSAERPRDERIPFQLHLRRDFNWEGRERDGKLVLLRQARMQKDLQDSRRDRVRKALDDKLPKLKRWKEHGFDTALVLELEMMGQGCSFDLLEEVVRQLCDREDLPDAVFGAFTMLYTSEAPIREGWIYQLHEAGSRPGLPIRDYTTFRY